MSRKPSPNQDRSYKQIKPPPSNVHIQREADFMKIQIGPRREVSYFILAGIMLLAALGFFSGNPFSASDSIVPALMALGLLAIGCLLLYKHIYQVIELDRKHLQTNLQITPYLQHLNVENYEITGYTQFFIRVHDERVKNSWNRRYWLCGQSRQHPDGISLIMLRSKEIAWYVEQEIEEFLGIEDRAVEGEEVPRD